MSGFAPNIISTQSLTELFTGVNTAFTQMTFDEQTIADKISFVNSNAQGMIYDYPFSPVAGKETDWPEGKSREYAGALVYKVTGQHVRIAPPDEMIFDSTLRYDLYGMLQGKLSAIASRAKRIWDRRLAALILQNPTTYDGTALWNTAHPVNPNDTSLGTFTNDIAGIDIDEAGFATALDALKQIRWADGQILNADDSGLVVLVPTKALEIKARKLIFGSMIPNIFGANTAAAAISNPFMGLKGMVRDVVYLPELQDISVTNSSKYWYIMNCSHPVHRPLVTSIVKMPEFHYAGLDPNDWVRVDKGGITYGWDAIGQVGPALPQFTVRGLTP